MFADTQQGVREKAVKTEPAAMPPHVRDFVTANGLDDFLKDAHHQLEQAFERKVDLSCRLFRDPQTGRTSLSVDVVVGDADSEEKYFNRFCHRWWYDQIGSRGHLVGFDLMEGVGI